MCGARRGGDGATGPSIYNSWRQAPLWPRSGGARATSKYSAPNAQIWRRSGLPRREEAVFVGPDQFGSAPFLTQFRAWPRFLRSKERRCEYECPSDPPSRCQAAPPPFDLTGPRLTHMEARTPSAGRRARRRTFPLICQGSVADRARLKSAHAGWLCLAKAGSLVLPARAPTPGGIASARRPRGSYAPEKQKRENDAPSPPAKEARRWPIFSHSPTAVAPPGREARVCPQTAQ